MAAPSFVFTIDRLAEMLGEDEEWLHELASQLEPEEGSRHRTEAGITLSGTEREHYAASARG